jgi:predicted transcriptional regulator
MEFLAHTEFRALCDHLAALYGRPRSFVVPGFRASIERAIYSERWISDQARQGMAGAEPITVGYIRYQ